MSTLWCGDSVLCWSQISLSCSKLLSFVTAASLTYRESWIDLSHEVACDIEDGAPRNTGLPPPDKLDTK